MSCLFALPTLFDGMLAMVVLFITKIVYELGYTIMNIGMGSLLGVMATPDIPDIATRDAKAEVGADLICKMVERMDMPHVIDQLRKLEQYGLENEEKFPWMPSAWNRNH